MDGDPTVPRKFEIQSRSYSKGIWTVYRATEKLLDRPVELRLYGTPLAPGSAAEEGFLRRHREVAALDHRSIQGILDFGIVDQQGYLTTSLRDSQSLQYLFAADELGNLERERRFSSAIDLLDALVHMHEIGMIHGSIATDTILWERTRLFAYFAWFPALEDAGVEFSCRLAEVPDGHRGERADLYRLALILHRLLTDVDPHPLDQLEDDTAAVQADGVREDLYRVLARALDRDPSRGYPEAASLLRDIQKLHAKERIRWELEKSVSTMELPSEFFEIARSRRRADRQSRDVVPTPPGWLDALRGLPPALQGILILFLMMFAAFAAVQLTGG